MHKFLTDAVLHKPLKLLCHWELHQSFLRATNTWQDGSQSVFQAFSLTQQLRLES